MQAHQILQADLLDILFEHRNKAYGAYELRKQYATRMYKALSWMIGLVLLLSIGVSLRGKEQNAAFTIQVLDSIKLEHFPDHPEPPQPPPPTPVEPPAPVATTAHLPPLIVPDELAPETEVPEASQLDSTVIGTANIDGTPEFGNAPPAVVEERGTGAAIAPAPQEDDAGKVWEKVENPASFPGGAAAWQRYLERNLRVPDAAIDNGTQGMVQVQFVVDESGNISEVVALNDPGDGLADEAMRIIRKGPKWTPAEQNGRKVKFRHTQRITFRVDQ